MARFATMLIRTFVETTTMRGFGKFLKTRHVAMRLLWCVYIISMLSLLTASTYFLIAEYASFHTTVQSSEQVQDITPLPSITVCSQSPIGGRAAQLWRNHTMLSPRQLSLRLRSGMLQAYKQGRVSVASELFFADKLSTYFQNIPLSFLSKVGMQQDELVLFCIMRHSKNNNPSVSHDEACAMQTTRVRHPLYANCYEIVIDDHASAQVSSVSLVLQSGFLPPGNETPVDSHVHDVFTQSQGMRITLHEPDTYPDIDAKGVSVGLGKLTEIKYQVVKNKRLQLGVDNRNCKSAEEAKAHRLLDVDRWYGYTYTACISEALGEIILEACKCVSAFHLVDKLPNSTHPFCHYFREDGLEDLQNRLECVRNVQIPEKINQIRATTCAPRCEYKEFPVQVSSSNWLPTKWQLRFAMTITSAWDTLASCTNSTKTSKALEAERDVLEFMTSKNPDHSHIFSQLDLSRLSMVTVSRLSYNSIKKVETQQITLSALLSRIGGVGSLTIGCTLAFFFELIELTYLFQLKWRSQNRKEAEASPAAVSLKEGTVS